MTYVTVDFLDGGHHEILQCTALLHPEYTFKRKNIRLYIALFIYVDALI